MMRRLALWFCLVAMPAAAQEPCYALSLSTSSTLSPAGYVHGASVAGRIYVFVTPRENVSIADIYVDGVFTRGLNHLWVMEYDTTMMLNGTHIMTAQVVTETGGQGELTATFTVNN